MAGKTANVANRVVLGYGLAVAHLARIGRVEEARDLLYAVHKPLRDYERSGLEHYDLDVIRKLFTTGIDLRRRPGEPHLVHLSVLRTG